LAGPGAFAKCVSRENVNIIVISAKKGGVLNLDYGCTRRRVDDIGGAAGVGTEGAGQEGKQDEDEVVCASHGGNGWTEKK
jgi:hypothetical protein